MAHLNKIKVLRYGSFSDKIITDSRKKGTDRWHQLTRARFVIFVSLHI